VTYVFDSTSGATFGQLQDLVLTNAFSASRYTEFSKAWLNDAVTDVCRKLRVQRNMTVLNYDATGLVAQPATPFFHLEELWLAKAGSSGSGEQAFAANAIAKLEPLPTRSTAPVVGTTPVFYTARRAAAPASRYPQLRIVVLPVAAAGQVAIVGLQRPTVMAATGDLTGLGADLDDAVLAFVKARMFRNEDDVDMSTFWQAEYERCLRGAVWLENHSDGPSTTPGTWDDGLLPDGGR
jgi:hypothetical protein